jgi:hypothetical protein
MDLNDHYQPFRFSPEEGAAVPIGQGLDERHNRLDGDVKGEICTSSGAQHKFSCRPA